MACDGSRAVYLMEKAAVLCSNWERNVSQEFLFTVLAKIPETLFLSHAPTDSSPFLHTSILA